MKPIQVLYPASIRLMRLGLLLLAYSEYFKTLKAFNFKELSFYVAAIFIISAVIIFISNFYYKATLVVLSGLAIMIVSVFNIIDKLDGGLSSALIINIIVASIAMFFLSNRTTTK